MTDTERFSAPEKEHMFEITRTFDAPRDLVFKAYSERDRLIQWWGPKGFTVESASLDFRPGGTFHYGMRSPGGQMMWGKFVYREIVPPERIVFVSSFSDPEGGTTRAPFNDHWPLEVLNRITFTEHDGKTTLTLSGSPINATGAEMEAFDAARDSMRQGFTGTLDQLAAHLGKTMSGAKTTLTPHLCCRNASDAVEFYQKAFGAEPLSVSRLPDGRVMHAALSMNGATIYLTDEFPEQCTQSPQSLGGTPVTLHLQVPDCDAVFQRAVEAGCEALMAPEDMFWGDRYAAIIDPYGHKWGIGTTVRQVSPEELQQAVASFSGNPA